METLFDSKNVWPIRCGVKDLTARRRSAGNKEENSTNDKEENATNTNSNLPMLGQYQLQGSKWQKKRLTWRVKLTPLTPGG